MKMQKTLCFVMILITLGMLSACGANDTVADTNPSPSENSENTENDIVSHDGEPTENPNEPSDPTGSDGSPVTVDPNTMTADERRELLMSNEENLPYFMHSEMSEERMEYRFNVYRYGLNFVNEHAVSGDGDLYDDLRRNIFSYTDSAREICVTGTVEWCSRDGSFTEFLVKDNYAWEEIYFSVMAYTDVPVLEGDTVTCFGYVNGTELYTTTYENGSVSEHEFPSIYLEDMFINNSGRKVAEAAVLSSLTFYEGSPNYSDAEMDFFFFGSDAVYYNENYLTADTVNDHPYTVYGYYYEPELNCYTCLIQYSEFEYPDGEYTTMTVSPYAIDFKTPDGALQNAYAAFENFVPSTLPLNTNNSANGHMYDWYRRFG